MALTPFDTVPKQRFFVRLSALSGSLLIVLGIGVLGLYDNYFQAELIKGPSLVLPFWQTALRHYASLLQSLTQIPEICWSNHAVNDFQRHQCQDYWQHLITTASTASVPILLVCILSFLLYQSFTDLYRSAQRKLKAGKKLIGGTVTRPAEMKQDFFGWLYCLVPISVELQDRRQVTLYVASDQVLPRSGEKVIAFEVGEYFGTQRRLGVPYAPHIAVVRGS